MRQMMMLLGAGSQFAGTILSGWWVASWAGDRYGITSAQKQLIVLAFFAAGVYLFYKTIRQAIK